MPGGVGGHVGSQRKGEARAVGTWWRGTGLCRVLAFSVFLHIPAPICRARSSLVTTQTLCVPSTHRTHLSNRPGLLGRNHTRLQPGERAQRAAAPPGARCLFSTSQRLRTAGATGQMAGGRCEPSRWQAIRPQTKAREMSEVSGKGCGGTAG